MTKVNQLPALLRITGQVQHYDWGGFEYIPNLIGVPNSDRKPFAELWLGAHPLAPSSAIVDGQARRLDELVRADPGGLLGQSCLERFGSRLPFLLKVLDVRQMLSIQAHPTKLQAEAGFARENAAGIPMDAPRRTYKDDNHKPEMHVALTEFWMLHGFRPLREILRVLEGVPEFSPLHMLARERAAAGPSEGEVLRVLYNRIMTSSQMETDRMLVPLIQRLQKGSPSDRTGPDYWSLRAARTFVQPEAGVDRGILSIYLMNIVHLRPGEGTYQPAGTLHAYLEGTNVELMANSDNVIRGGLTTKHLDPEELLRVIDFRGEHPQILGGKVMSQGESAYPTPAKEFELSRVSLASGGEWAADTGGSAEIWLVIEGEGRVRLAGDISLELQAGNAFFVRPGSAVTTQAGQAGLLLFRAFVPPRDPAPL